MLRTITFAGVRAIASPQNSSAKILNRHFHKLSTQPSPMPAAAAANATTLARSLNTEATASNDKQNDELERIYYGSLAPRMRAVKLFSLTTSCAGIAAQPILLEQGVKLGGTGMAVLLCGVGGFFTFVTPLLLHFVTKKYVTEVHYNAKTDEYIATTISLFLRKIKTKFRPSDVKVPDVPGMFTSFYVNKKPLFVDPALFTNTEHYVRIMGYDKPIDFKLDVTENQTPKSEKRQTKE